jgi:hypothetical protein
MLWLTYLEIYSDLDENIFLRPWIFLGRRHDAEHNDIQPNGTQHYDTQQKIHSV